jgi:hypothetical protein
MYKASVPFMLGQDKKVLCKYDKKVFYAYVVTLVTHMTRTCSIRMLSHRCTKPVSRLCWARTRTCSISTLLCPKTKQKTSAGYCGIFLFFKKITGVVPENEAKAGDTSVKNFFLKKDILAKMKPKTFAGYCVYKNVCVCIQYTYI